MSRLGWINFLLLQWFFMRLTFVVDKPNEKFKLSDYDKMIEGDYRPNLKYQWWSIQYFIWPFTGWWNDFKFIGKKRIKRISKPEKFGSGFAKQMLSDRWWCEHCQVWVDPCDVTYEETHDVRNGGCGNPVSYFIKTINLLLKKKHESGFAIVPNKVLTDKNLTNTEKVVVCYLCGRPENWKVNNSDVMAVASIKTRHKMAEVWNNLTKHGYIKRVEIKSSGKFSGYDLELFPEEPCVDNQHTAPCVVPPHAVSNPLGQNSTHIKKESFKKEEEKKEESSSSDFIKTMASEMRTVLRKHFGSGFVDMCPDGATVDETMVLFAEYWHYQKERKWDAKNPVLKKAIVTSFEQWRPVYDTKESVKAEVSSELNSDAFRMVTGLIEKLVYDMQVPTGESVVALKKFLDGDGGKFSREDWIEHIKDMRDGSGRTYHDLIRIATTRLKYMQ